MVLDAKSLKGIAIVSIADGEKVGTLDEMLFDVESRRLMVFKFARSGLFGGDRDLVHFSDVRSIGPDAVMIENRDVIRGERDLKKLKNLVDVKTLTALRVVTQDGAYVGNLATVKFDRHTGAITDVEITGTSLMSILKRNLEIPVNEIVSLGHDVLVVPNQYGPEVEDDTRSSTAESSSPESKKEPADTIPQLPERSN